MNIRLHISKALAAILIAASAPSLGAEEMDTTNLSNLRPFDYEIVVLKDGSRMYGYTGTEFADGSITFNTLISTRLAHREGLENQMKYTSREQLPGFIRKSLKRYEPFVKTLGLKETIQLATYPRYPKLFEPDVENDTVADSQAASNLSGEKGIVEKIIVLEESLDSIRYISFTPKTETIAYADIDERINPDLPPNINYGIRDRVITSDGKTYIGRITRRRPGRNIVITSDGTDKTIPIENVNITERMGTDPAKTIQEQAPFITRTVFKNGRSVIGTIILMDYETGDMKIISNTGNDTLHRKIDNLERRVYEINPHYPPKKVVRLDYSAAQVYADTILLTPMNVKISKAGIIDMKKIDLEQDAIAIPLSGDSITVSVPIGNRSAMTLTWLSDQSNFSSEVSLMNLLVKSPAPQTRIAKPANEATICTFNSIKKGYYILSLLESEQFYLLRVE